MFERIRGIDKQRAVISHRIIKYSATHRRENFPAGVLLHSRISDKLRRMFHRGGQKSLFYCDIWKKLDIGAAVIAGVCVAAYTAWVAAGDVFVSEVKRDIPIYCVQCEEKVCSMTFDASWDNGPMRKMISYLYL